MDHQKKKAKKKTEILWNRVIGPVGRPRPGKLSCGCEVVNGSAHLSSALF
jgi:hypothetical protein